MKKQIEQEKQKEVFFLIKDNFRRMMAQKEKTDMYSNTDDVEK